ncbi:hypothetical protein Tco_1034970 [Tanacetum coccineum]
MRRESATHSSSLVSAGPSRKRCRSYTADCLLIRADLLPPRKRLRDPSSTYCHEVSVEDSIETRAEGDIKRDTEDSHEADTESNIDSDILADIEADIAAEAAAAIEADASGSRETFENGLDVVIQHLYDHMLEFPTYRILDIKEEQRTREVKAITTDTKRTRMLERISVLDGSVMRLWETLIVERDQTDSVTDIAQKDKMKQNGQNRAREWKEYEKSKPKVYTSLMGQPVPILLGRVSPLTCYLYHSFNIDLMLVELGSSGVTIGMDWLSKYHAFIICDEKVVHIPYGHEVLMIYRDRSDEKSSSKLSIISCTKTHNYIQKGSYVFLAQITKKKAKDKLEEKRLEDVPIVRDFSEVFPEDLT